MKADQHVHLWRLSGTNGLRDMAWLTPAPPPVLLAYALGHADRMSAEKDTGADHPAPPVFGSVGSDLPINWGSECVLPCL
jgi:hypothetical protein